MSDMIPRPAFRSPGKIFVAVTRLAATLLCVAAIVSIARPAFAEIAVLPYKVDSPSDQFPASLGADYARLLSVAAMVSRGIEVHHPRDIEADLARNGINPQGTVTKEELESLGKSRLIDGFLVGTLSRAGGAYISESILFSVKSGQIVARTRVKSADLLELAELEIARAYPGQGDARGAAMSTRTDIAFVIDLSYNVKRDWEQVKKGVSSLARGVSGNWSGGTRVSIVPFSTANGPDGSTFSLKSALGVSEVLGRLVPKGANSAATVEKAMSDAVNNVAWRGDSSKFMVVISNSPFHSSTRLQRSAHSARKKGITVCTVALGDIAGDGRAYLRELSEIGGGFHADAAYHQKLFEARGEEIDLYLEGGRLFTSTEYDSRWKGGLFRGERQGSLRARPKEFLKEIFFDEKKTAVRPGTLEKAYVELTAKRIINAKPVANNVPAVLAGLTERYFGTAGRGTARNLGRALVYQDRVSIWIDITSEKDLAFFRERARDGAVFPLGVSLQRKKDSPYGIRFNPRYYVTGIDAGYLPPQVRVSLDDLIRKSKSYANRGMLQPPVWFVDLKVERVKFKGGKDVRDGE
ncbi:MAG TPA: vWA domain-containing protein [Spirochaetota bacterium]|nr:vWA domain-containing protein [Spirochaetota bacterium]